MITSREQANILTVLGAEIRNGKAISSKHVSLLCTGHKALTDLIVDHGSHDDIEDITRAIGAAIQVKATKRQTEHFDTNTNASRALRADLATMRRNAPRRPTSNADLAWQLLRMKGKR